MPVTGIGKGEVDGATLAAIEKALISAAAKVAAETLVNKIPEDSRLNLVSNRFVHTTVYDPLLRTHEGVNVFIAAFNDALRELQDGSYIFSASFSEPNLKEGSIDVEMHYQPIMPNALK